MYWNEIEGSILFNKVFSRDVEVNKIDIFDIKIDREAATVIICFDLVNELPDNPPQKWVKGYNRCRCGITCCGVKFLKIEGMSTDMPAKIEIQKNTPYSEVIIKGGRYFFKFEVFAYTINGPFRIY